MSEADAEDRHLAHHAANALLRVRHRLGIARAVRQEHAIRLHRQHVFRAGGRRNHRHAAALADQAAQDVVLDAVVVSDHVMLRRSVFHADNFRRLVASARLHPTRRRCGVVTSFARSVPSIFGIERALATSLSVIGFERRDHAAHDAVVAQMAHQRAGIDLGQHGNLVALEILFGDLLRAPVGADARELAHDQPLDVRTRGLVVVGVGAVIADFRIGENYDLPGVGRVGEDFLVAGDGGIKNDFAVTFAFCAVAFAAEDAARLPAQGLPALFLRGVDFIDFTESHGCYRAAASGAGCVGFADIADDLPRAVLLQFPGRHV